MRKTSLIRNHSLPTGARKVRPYIKQPCALTRVRRRHAAAPCASALRQILPIFIITLFTFSVLQPFSLSAFSDDAPIPSTTPGVPLSVDMQKAESKKSPAAQPVAPQPAEKSAPAPATPSSDDIKPKHNSKFFDDEDGYFDVSEFMATAYGFIPIVMPITEPAIGYGAGGGLIFIKRNPHTSDGKPQRPDISAVGGAYTENKTAMLFAGNSSVWHDGKLQTMAGGIYGTVHLDFYGIGTEPLASPVKYKIDVYGGGVQARYKLWDSHWSAGLGYQYANTNVGLEPGPDFPPNIPVQDFDTTVAGISPTIVFDNRDNIFTATRGFYAEATVPINGSAFGGDTDFQALDLTFVGYHLLKKDTLFLGLKVDGAFAFGSTPFYALPFVQLRGAQALRYSGTEVYAAEAELRWQFSKRFSVVGFAGQGRADYSKNGYSHTSNVTTGGVGVRYLIARAFGLHMGADVAWGPDGAIFYIQFGSAWMRL